MPAPRSAYGNRLCRLKGLVGVVEDCTERGCRFWEPGGAALEGRCAFETIDIERRPELTARLLAMRTNLGSGPAEHDEREVHALLRLLIQRGDD